jgi:hypothetical protein
MTTYTRHTAYRRNADGTLTHIGILRDSDGDPCDDCSYPLTRTEETVTMAGWPDEGTARVWLTEGGVEILIPETGSNAEVP